MPRHNRSSAAPSEFGTGARSLGEHRVSWRGEEYVVRVVGGSEKAYRCPGCDQQLQAGRSHVVTWPVFGDGADDRRHWHHPCWAARDRRTPGVLRTRSAPRY
jgi:hypothetical protein